MTTQPTDTATPRSSQSRASVLISISTPGGDTPICRLANSEEIVANLTVRQLIQRVISPNSLFSIGVPMSQLDAESPTALAIGEMLSAGCCEVVSAFNEQGSDQPAALDQPVRTVAREQVGTQGNRFLNITLDVRSAPDAAALTGEERRGNLLPEAVEVEELPAGVVIGEQSDPTAAEKPEPVSAPLPRPLVTTNAIVAIVAEPCPEELAGQTTERKEYVRKSDWLRAQFLPEVQELDFSGLFVGNLGLGIREERARRNVVLADPSRLTDILLRANGYRRSGDHARALICYQELVDIDPANADFRFLLGKTLLALDQRGDAADAFMRAKELGHEGAGKELDELKRSGDRSRRPLGFLRFWRQ